jgi:hypothetical protein
LYIPHLPQDFFIKSAPENPVLWAGMKGASAESRKNLNQMLKQVQHDNRVRVSFFCHPELVSGSRFLVLRVWVLKPRPVGGVLYSFISIFPRQGNRKETIGNIYRRAEDLLEKLI